MTNTTNFLPYKKEKGNQGSTFRSGAGCADTQSYQIAIKNLKTSIIIKVILSGLREQIEFSGPDRYLSLITNFKHPINLKR
jgi:hypothetical protein